jgi:hypothetical protein
VLDSQPTEAAEAAAALPATTTKQCRVRVDLNVFLRAEHGRLSRFQSTIKNFNKLINGLCEESKQTNPWWKA